MVALAVLLVLVPPLYRFAVGFQIRRIFRSLSRGDWQPVLDSLAPEFTYLFHGDTSISGLRRRRETVDAWFRRLYRILPSPRFEPEDIVVGGPPWNTRVAALATISGDLADGTPYRNTFMQRVTIRFGRVTAIETVEDTQRLERAMQALAATGFDEAVAPPLTD
jgi:ketosteroid isomerase-like protein